jgi:ribose transport system substrate-binding protein
MSAFRNRTLAAAAAVTMALTMTACGSSSSTDSSGSAGGSASAGSGGSDYTIGVSVADQKSLFYIAAADGMKKAAEDAGVNLVLLSADNSSTQQVNQVNDLITQQVDALIFIAQDATAAAAGVKAANNADIPVIAVDQKPESGDGKLATYIATDSVKAADELCTWVFDKMGGSGEIGILQGVLGSTAELQRSQGCQQAIDKNPGITVVGKESANWDETEGYKAAQNMLQANPNIKAIIGESDAMGLGAAKAAQDAGVDIITVGIDGFPTMITAIKEGLTDATQAQIPYKMGQFAVADSLKVLNGETVPELQYQDTVLVTSENVNSVNPEDFYGPNVK